MNDKPDYSYVLHDDYNIKGFTGNYRFLSNFYPAPVYFDGLLYPSTEHAYQAAKTEDVGVRSALFLNCTSGQAKKNGRIITVRPDWERVKFDVMSAVVFDKFYRNIHLRNELLTTGTKYLEETNHWNDTYWGVCNEKGHNNLGIVLMGVRLYWSVKYPEYLGRPIPKITPLF